MDSELLDPSEVAADLRRSLSLLYRSLKQPREDGQLTLPESSALAKLVRGGPTTAAQLARQEQITPQSIAVTLGGLEQRGLIERASDPDDGRRVMLSATERGVREVHNKRAARSALLASALETSFSSDEIAVLAAASPLLERLAQL